MIDNNPTRDLKTLLALPTEERIRILEESAANAAALYESGGPLSGLEIVDSQ